jgi:hypothetical protein
MEAQKTSSSQSNLEQKRTTLTSNYTTNHRNKTAWYWHKNRHKDQWTIIEDPDINPHIYNHLIFHKGAQNIHWRKLNIHLFKIETRSSLSPCSSINSKWIKGLSLRPETVKLLKERTGKKLEHKEWIIT